MLSAVIHISNVFFDDPMVIIVICLLHFYGSAFDSMSWISWILYTCNHFITWGSNQSFYALSLTMTFTAIYWIVRLIILVAIGWYSIGYNMLNLCACRILSFPLSTILFNMSFFFQNYVRKFWGNFSLKFHFIRIWWRNE